MVLPAIEAIGASVARAARVDRDALADGERRHARAQRMHDARHLMPEHHRLFEADDAETAVIVIMQIGAADAAGADADQHFARLGYGHWHRVDAQIFGGVKDGGAGGDL